MDRVSNSINRCSKLRLRVNCNPGDDRSFCVPSRPLQVFSSRMCQDDALRFGPQDVRDLSDSTSRLCEHQTRQTKAGKGCAKPRHRSTALGRPPECWTVQYKGEFKCKKHGVHPTSSLFLEYHHSQPLGSITPLLQWPLPPSLLNP